MFLNFSEELTEIPYGIILEVPSEIHSKFPTGKLPADLPENL